MTCIVGLKANNKVYIAGERGASTEDSIMHLTKPKIHRFGPYVIGFAGTMEGQRLAYTFDPPRPHEDEDLDTFMHTTFLKYLRDFYDEWWVDTSKDSELEMVIGIKDRLYEHSSSDMSEPALKTALSGRIVSQAQAASQPHRRAVRGSTAPSKPNP